MIRFLLKPLRYKKKKEKIYNNFDYLKFERDNY